MPFRDLPGVTQCRFQQGEYLISVGEQIDHVYYLVKGIVHREFLTVSGYESILSIKTGGSVVGALVGILLFYWPQNKGISDYNFIARTNCICYRVPKDVCMEYLRQHRELRLRRKRLDARNDRHVDTRRAAILDKSEYARVVEAHLRDDVVGPRVDFFLEPAHVLGRIRGLAVLFGIAGHAYAEIRPVTVLDLAVDEHALVHPGDLADQLASMPMPVGMHPERVLAAQIVAAQGQHILNALCL